MEGLTIRDFFELFGPSIIAAVLAGLLCGLLGVFVVLRRVAFVSAALGQISGLGIAIGFLIGGAFGVDPHQAT
ncbi:MAG: metal ABC transporter permease, partial [Myxococcaceae bacterium]